MITIFTAPKPFTGEIGRLQRNAIWSWLALGPEVEVLLVGEEDGMARAAAELGVRMLPEIDRNPEGTPLVSSVFRRGAQAARHDLLCYANADILFFPDLLTAVSRVRDRFRRFLVVGQRWDLEMEEEWRLEDFSEEGKREALLERAQRHPRSGSDYFVFTSDQYRDMPDFALGRSGWDNWMIYAGRASGVPVVDGSEAITVLHQDHDYGHLPGGESHYRLPESRRNVALAGGREMMFTLDDTTWRLTPEGLERKPWWAPGSGRRIESSLYALLGPGAASRMARLLLHPVESLRYFTSRLANGGEGTDGAGLAVEAEPSSSPVIESGTPDRSESHEV